MNYIELKLEDSQIDFIIVLHKKFKIAASKKCRQYLHLFFLLKWLSIQISLKIYMHGKRRFSSCKHQELWSLHTFRALNFSRQFSQVGNQYNKQVVKKTWLVLTMVLIAILLREATWPWSDLEKSLIWMKSKQNTIIKIRIVNTVLWKWSTMLEVKSTTGRLSNVSTICYAVPLKIFFVKKKKYIYM